MNIEERNISPLHSVQATKIPAAIIGVMSNIYSDYYTHSQINSLFLAASAPDEIPETNKPDKITNWLRLINNKSIEPLKILGALLEGFLEQEPDTPNISCAQEKIKDTLSQNGLVYSRGGFISKAGGTYSTKSLQERIAKQGLIAIDCEKIGRASCRERV